jgi:long-chain acyl-CoA synthetase
MTNFNNLSHHSLADFIETCLLKYGDLPAFHCLGQTLSFTDIEKKSRALASWLQQQSGLSAGDRVIIQLPNLNQYPIAAFAILRAGMVIVNTNPLYTSREMKHQFNDSGAKAIIILQELLPKLDEIIHETDIEQVIVTKATDLLTADIEDLESTTYIAFNQTLKEGEKLTLLPRADNLKDDVCVLQYTGGTTGVSKGACLSHHNFIAINQQLLARFGDNLTPKEEVLACPLPLYHIYAFSVNLITFFSQGNLNVLIPNPRDLNGFIEAIKPFKITGFAGINTLFIGLCQNEQFTQLDFSKLKFTISGGSTLTMAAASLWLKTTNCTITEGYGLSESTAVVCLNHIGKEVMASVGQPLLATEVELWDDQGNIVAEGTSGELVVRGPQILKGYWNMPDESAKAISADGFFKTGDIAIRLPDGCIKIVDRLKDMIIVSGFNVYPNEVEEVLTRHQYILEAAVIGEVDDKTGEKVCAFVTISKPINTNEIIDFCREHLTAYKVPKQIVIKEELPKSTVGKILRRALRA